MNGFIKLLDRKEYGASRRSDLLVKLLKESQEATINMYSFECEVENILKRRVGYSDWDKNWDVGLHLKEEKVYLMLSKKNSSGSFDILEKVEYTKDLKYHSWISDCLHIHTR